MGSQPNRIEPSDPEAVGRVPVTLAAILRYFRTRAKTSRLSPDARNWFADAATLIEGVMTHVD